MSAIVGICDAFDAMTSARPYRKPMPLERALSIIGENLGTQFDERFGKIFLTFGETENLRHIAGHSDDGIPLRHCATCGPTIVVRRNSVVNPQVFCPACGTGYQLDGDHNAPVPTGSHASAQDLEPEPDEELISRLIAQAPAFF